METIWWKARVTSERMIERMKFLVAYWGRGLDTGAPRPESEKQYPVAQVLLRAVEAAFEEVKRDLRVQVLDPERSYDEKQQALWWIKMAREGRNGDPFPGVSYAPECPGCSSTAACAKDCPLPTSAGEGSKP